MSFYTFDENNSGGEFVGKFRFVIVEASSPDEANHIAESSGYVYFNGVDDGLDCRCCGDRWEEVWNHDAKEHPMIYGEHPSSYADSFLSECLAVVIYETGEERIYHIKRKE